MGPTFQFHGYKPLVSTCPISILLLQIHWETEGSPAAGGTVSPHTWSPEASPQSLAAETKKDSRWHGGWEDYGGSGGGVGEPCTFRGRKERACSISSRMRRFE